MSRISNCNSYLFYLLQLYIYTYICKETEREYQERRNFPENQRFYRVVISIGTRIFTDIRLSSNTY